MSHLTTTSIEMTGLVLPLRVLLHGSRNQDSITYKTEPFKPSTPPTQCRGYARGASAMLLIHHPSLTTQPALIVCDYWHTDN